ncbi:MAG: type II toxin-antitoxin system death-on-curing family toxin [Beijerinckiaceae bacterium]|nr:type II toxin-antitoxin system death-on-curing family toxin [Beijerinckiaceae bacterium]
MVNWNWLDREIILAIHEEQLAQHGGGVGLRDDGLLMSALSRPINFASYEPDATIFRLAASYAYGIARNHPFIDGNKRTAFVAMELFLLDHGWLLTAEDGDAVLTFLALASGELEEDRLADWIEHHARRIDQRLTPSLQAQ